MGLMSCATFFMISVSTDYLLRAFCETYSTLGLEKRLDWQTRVISSLHAVISSSLSIYLLLTDEIITNDKLRSVAWQTVLPPHERISPKLKCQLAGQSETYISTVHNHNTYAWLVFLVHIVLMWHIIAIFVFIMQLVATDSSVNYGMICIYHRGVSNDAFTVAAISVGYFIFGKNLLFWLISMIFIIQSPYCFFVIIHFYFILHVNASNQYAVITLFPFYGWSVFTIDTP